MNQPPSRRKKRAVAPPCSKLTSPKSPRTVSSLGSVQASAWCDPVQAAVASAWQPAQAADPT